jgi:hypothetical protein
LKIGATIGDSLRTASSFLGPPLSTSARELSAASVPLPMVKPARAMSHFFPIGFASPCVTSPHYSPVQVTAIPATGTLSTPPSTALLDEPRASHHYKWAPHAALPLMEPSARHLTVGSAVATRTPPWPPAWPRVWRAWVARPRRIFGPCRGPGLVLRRPSSPVATGLRAKNDPSAGLHFQLIFEKNSIPETYSNFKNP